MRNFKTFLLEYLTDTQRDRYKDVHMTDKARADTDHFFGAGNDKIHGEIAHDDKSEIHKQLETHLGQEISHEDYAKGTIKDKHNRDVKIGRLIKDNDLRIQFDKDPARAIGKAPVLKTTTVRGVEVAGQTNHVPDQNHPKGHLWGDISCKNVENGINKRYLKSEIKHGTVVHFVHDQNGQEMYRATIHPHHNESGHVAYAVDAVYGIRHPKFVEDSNRIARELSGKYRRGTFIKHPEVYNDNGTREIQHPNITTEDITHSLKHGTDWDKYEVINHPLINADHISHVMDHESDPKLRAYALRNRAATPEHIMRGLNDPSSAVRRSAVFHEKLNADHIEKAIQPNQSAEIRQIAIQSHGATPKQLTHVIKHDSDPETVKAAIKNPNANADHLALALAHPDPHVRRVAMRSRKLNADHINTAIKDSDDVVVDSAVTHPLSTSGHVSYLLKHGSSGAMRSALDHSNTKVTPEHIHSVINSSDPKFTPDVKDRAALHPNASSQNITDAIKLGDKDINYEIARSRPHLEASHIDQLLKIHSGDRDMMGAVSRRKELTSDHISHLLKHGDYNVRRNVAGHHNLTHEHMDYIAKHEPDEGIRSAMFYRGRTPSHITSHVIRNDPDSGVRYNAMMYGHPHPDDLAHMATHDVDSMNISAAIRHPDTPLHAIQHVSDTYKGNPLGQEANRIIHARTQKD